MLLQALEQLDIPISRTALTYLWCETNDESTLREDVQGKEEEALHRASEAQPNVAGEGHQRSSSNA